METAPLQKLYNKYGKGIWVKPKQGEPVKVLLKGKGKSFHTKTAKNKTKEVDENTICTIGYEY